MPYGNVTMKGGPINLLGNAVTVGLQAPDCTLIANDLSEVELSSYKGKTCLVSVVPSLDTPVCDIQTKRFNQEVINLGGDIVVLTISMDLPFAQKRWCGAAGIDRVITLSDHRDAAFGKAFGVLIEGLRLLTRSIFVLDGDQKIQYVQIVPEITSEPDYGAAFDAIKKL